MNRLVIISVIICLAVVQGGGRVVDERSSGQVGSSNHDHPLVGESQLTFGRLDRNTKIASTKRWTAHLVYEDEFICAGTIVHERFILTTGSCLKDIYQFKLKVYVGEKKDQLVEMENIDFIADKSSNIGLIRLGSAIKLENGVLKAELPTKDYVRETATIYWNQLSINVSPEECQDGMSKNFFCDTSSDRNTCFGFHGSGAIYEGNSPILAGIVNLNTGTCGSYVLSNVFSLRQWITEKSKGEL